MMLCYHSAMVPLHPPWILTMTTNHSGLMHLRLPSGNSRLLGAVTKSKACKISRFLYLSPAPTYHPVCVLESARVSKRGQSVVRGGRGSMLDLRVPTFGSDFPVNHTEIKRGKEIFLFSELNPSLSTFKTHGNVQ